MMLNQTSIFINQYPDHDALLQDLEGLTDDPMAQLGTNMVIYRGNPSADIMLIGEAPGAEEDRLRKPFVGRSGQLMDKILKAVDLDVETDVYITNTVKRRPPDNRNPTSEEIDYYYPYLMEQIRLVDPKIIILVGKIAMATILGEKRGITKVRGQWTEQHGRWIMPVYHPAYLLRNPRKTPGSPKAQMWDDIREIRRKYDELRSA